VHASIENTAATVESVGEAVRVEGDLGTRPDGRWVDLETALSSLHALARAYPCCRFCPPTGDISVNAYVQGAAGEPLRPLPLVSVRDDAALSFGFVQVAKV